jgi:hypothetical protein
MLLRAAEILSGGELEFLSDQTLEEVCFSLFFLFFLSFFLFFSSFFLLFFSFFLLFFSFF